MSGNNANRTAIDRHLDGFGGRRRNLDRRGRLIPGGDIIALSRLAALLSAGALLDLDRLLLFLFLGRSSGKLLKGSFQLRTIAVDHDIGRRIKLRLGQVELRGEIRRVERSEEASGRESVCQYV